MLLCKILYTGTRKIKRKKEKKGKNERRRKKRENNYRNVLAMLKKKTFSTLSLSIALMTSPEWPTCWV